MGNLFPTPGSTANTSAPNSGSGALLDTGSASVRDVKAVITEVAQSDVPVLLLGERGVGKEYTAQRIHDLSGRGAQPLCKLNCSGLTAEELARAHRDAEQCGGTIFLTDAEDLSSSCQLYLRDVLYKTSDPMRRQGKSARFIFGSTADLEIEMKSRRMREDLYYRISGVCLHLPPLRQRKEDIPALVEHFVEKYSRKYACPVPKISAETRRLFQEYSWPGNLEELGEAVRVLVILGNEQLAMAGLRSLLQNGAGNNHHGTVSLKAASRAASHEVEKQLILDVLTRTRWNRRLAAKQLQISYKALLYKLKQIGCEEPGLVQRWERL